MKKFINSALATALMLLGVNSAFSENYNDRFISEASPVIAFTNARVIDGTGTAAKENQTVVIRDGRITEIGSKGKVRIPKEAKRISLRGKSLLPGWVMTHEHLYYWNLPDNTPPSGGGIAGSSWIENISQSISFPRLHLSAGVTSARTVGTFNPYADLKIKKAIDSGILNGPDYDLSFFISGIPLKVYTENDEEGAREAVRFWVKRGFTSVKAHGITGDRLEAIINESHKMGVKVTADLGHMMSSHREAIDFGIDQFEHVVTLSESTWGNPIPLNDKRAYH